MRQFLNKLFGNSRTTRTAHRGQQSPRRVTLQLEGLEDRLVMTTANPLSTTSLRNVNLGSVALTQPIVRLTSPVSQNGSTLNVNTNAGDSVSFQLNGSHQLAVVYNHNSVFDFVAGSINTVVITLPGNNSVTFDDSFGIPFAAGTRINLFGAGSASNIDYVTLQGTGEVVSSESYTEGAASNTLSFQNLNLTFNMTGFVPYVTDTLQITGNYQVSTSDPEGVQLNDAGMGQQHLQGLNNTGMIAHSLFFSGKPWVELDLFGTANVGVNTTQPETTEQQLTVQLHAAGESLAIGQTPSSVPTRVFFASTAINSNDSVAVLGNSSPVTIDGVTGTSVTLGFAGNENHQTDSTKGILANVVVSGATSMTLADDGDPATTPQNVRITENTISATGGFGNPGLFGNDNVTVSYYGVQFLNFVTGDFGGTYTVQASQPGARFFSHIDIQSDFAFFFTANVYVDAGSQLNLSVFNNATHNPMMQPVTQLNVYERGANSISVSSGQNGAVGVEFEGVQPGDLSQIFFDAIGKVSTGTW
jgi:hypothetical protein